MLAVFANFKRNALLALPFLAALLMSPMVAEAQGFQGSEPGDVGQVRVAPGSRLFNPDQRDVCIRVHEVERTGSRTCIYRCNSGQSFERRLSRTRFCDPSLTLTAGEVRREITGEEGTQCRLRRLRLTRTDKLCVYDCAGETVTQAIPTSRTCDRDYVR